MHTCNNFAFLLLHHLYLFALSFAFFCSIFCSFLLYIWYLFDLYLVFVFFIFVFVCFMFVFVCLIFVFVCFIFVFVCFFCICLLQIIQLRACHNVCSGPAGKFWPLVLVLCLLACLRRPLVVVDRRRLVASFALSLASGSRRAQ